MKNTIQKIGNYLNKKLDKWGYENPKEKQLTKDLESKYQEVDKLNTTIHKLKIQLSTKYSFEKEIDNNVKLHKVHSFDNLSGYVRSEVEKEYFEHWLKNTVVENVYDRLKNKHYVRITYKYNEKGV